MKTYLVTISLSLVATSLLLNSCKGKEARIEAKENKGFRLPKGDAERGKSTFVGLSCNRCHSVEGVDFPAAEEPSDVNFALGGEVRKVKSYGELVTAIIQPQHVIAPGFLATIQKAEREGTASPMPDYNEVMTVRQMTDLVTFLHDHYKKQMPDYNSEFYPYY